MVENYIGRIGDVTHKIFNHPSLLDFLDSSKGKLVVLAIVGIFNLLVLVNLLSEFVCCMGNCYYSHLPIQYHVPHFSLVIFILQEKQAVVHLSLFLNDMHVSSSSSHTHTYMYHSLAKICFYN